MTTAYDSNAVSSQEILSLLLKLTYYIVQMEHQQPEQLINAVYLFPGKGETMADVDRRNAELRDLAVALVSKLDLPFHQGAK